MKTTRWVTGKNLTEDKLARTIALLSLEQKKTVIEWQWEYIPQGNFTDDEKLGFIICAMPSGGFYNPEFLAETLLKGPKWVNPKTAPAAKPNMYAAIKAERPDIIEQMIARIRPRKHVPKRFLMNDEWAGIVAIACMIDGVKMTEYVDAQHTIDHCIRWLKYGL